MAIRRFRRRGAALLIATLAVCQGVWAQTEDGQSLRRYGLFVGANDGGPDRVRLEYAETDSRAMMRVMQDVGGMSPSDAVVLVNPDATRVRRELQGLADRIGRERGQARRVEFLFYYSGHSDEQSLLLGGTAMGYQELRDAVKGVNADISITILDSCASGAFTRLKGGQRAAPFLVDESSEVQGQVYLTSSSENEASQESDAIGGSFFTHSLVSALRGAADLSQDGKVTLHEAYQYAQADTLARTENTQAGPQHPSWYINLTGTGDLVLSDLRSTSASLVMSADLSGTVFIRDDRGNLVAEVRKLASLPLTLALPSGSYTVSMYTDVRTSEARVSLREGTQTALGPSDFRDSARVATRSRGDEVAGEASEAQAETDAETEWRRADEDAARAAVRRLDPEGISGFIRELGTEIQRRIWGGLEPGAAAEGEWVRTDDPAPTVVPEVAPVQPRTVVFSLGFVPGLTYPGVHPARKRVSLNALISSSDSIVGMEATGIMNFTTHDVLGGQVAGVGNIVSGGMSGYQGSGVFNIVDGRTVGVQTAGVFNLVDSPALAAQLAGVFNIADGAVAGGQFAGVFNIAHGVAGAQMAGVFNISKDAVNGVQAGGVFSHAGQIRGLQISGVVNTAGTVAGAQIGVVNVASQARGLQIGVVNIASSLRGLPIGLVNIIADGLVLGGLSWDDRGFTTLELASGTHFYTLLSAGAQLSATSQPTAMAFQTGVGVHLTLGPFYAAADVSARQVIPLPLGPERGGMDAIPFPSVRGRVGVVLFDRIGGFVGYALDMDLRIPGVPANSIAHTGTAIPLTIGPHEMALYPRFTAGVTIGCQPGK